MKIKHEPIRIQNFFENVIQNYSDIEFQQNFRLTTGAFELFLHQIGPHMPKNIVGRPQQLSTEKQILAIIWLLANPECFRFLILF